MTFKRKPDKGAGMADVLINDVSGRSGPAARIVDRVVEFVPGTTIWLGRPGGAETMRFIAWSEATNGERCTDRQASNGDARHPSVEADFGRDEEPGS
jgi:hypothetical protein